jgi:hypothetical protein
VKDTKEHLIRVLAAWMDSKYLCLSCEVAAEGNRKFPKKAMINAMAIYDRIIREYSLRMFGPRPPMCTGLNEGNYFECRFFSCRQSKYICSFQKGEFKSDPECYAGCPLFKEDKE